MALNSEADDGAVDAKAAVADGKLVPTREACLAVDN